MSGRLCNVLAIICAFALTLGWASAATERADAERVADLLRDRASPRASCALEPRVQDVLALKNAIDTLAADTDPSAPLAMELLVEGETAAALKVLERRSKAEPGDASSWFARAAILAYTKPRDAGSAYREGVARQASNALALSRYHDIIDCFGDRPAEAEEILKLLAARADAKDPMAEVLHAWKACEIARKKQNFANGTRLCEAALAHARTLGNWGFVSEISADLASLAGEQKRFKDAIALIDRARDDVSTHGVWRAMVRVIIVDRDIQSMIGTATDAPDDIERMQANARAMLLAEEKLGNVRGQAHAHLSLCQFDVTDAIDHGKRAAELFLKIDSQVRAALAERCLGGVLSVRGALLDAADAFHRAADLFRDNDMTTARVRDLVNEYTQLAETDQRERIMSVLKEAETAIVSARTNSFEYDVLLARGDVERGAARLDSAETYYLRTMHLCDIGARICRIKPLRGLAEVYVAKGDKPKGCGHLKEAEAIVSPIADRGTLAAKVIRDSIRKRRSELGCVD